MKIAVKSSGRPNICLPFPTMLALNRFTAGFISHYLKDCSIDIAKDQTIIFIKALNRYRRRHPDWVLLEVQGSDGEYVSIQL